MTPILNRHLWFLTGRCDGFVNPALNTGLRYGNARPSSGVVAARKLLHLDDTTTDYYVIGAMASLVAAGPTLGDDISTLFLPQTLRVRPPTVAGGELRPATGDFPLMLHRPQALPVAMNWYVRRISASRVLVTNDAGFAEATTYRFAGGVVYVDWPEATGFQAAFAPTGAVWVTGSEVSIHTQPSGYPYAAVVEAARSSHTLIRLLSVEGELAAFHASPSSLQQVGALCAAVVKQGEKTNPT